jgi:hypothetical protein
MMDQEERIAETLRRHAPIFVKPMPKGTRLRVRLRQAGLSLLSLTVFAALAIGTLGALSAMPRLHQPASEQTVPPPSGPLPSPQGDADGVNDAAPAPLDGPTAGEDTTAHGTNSTVPYTEQVEGQEVYLLTQKHVVAFGHVSGVEWSLAGYDTRPFDGGGLFTHFLGGPCGDLMVGDQGEYGGIAFCMHTPETAPDAQFAMAGFGNDSDDTIGAITGYAGLVGDQVATVELRLANGQTTELPLYDAPTGIDARYFGVFLKPGAEGDIVALGADGAQLGHGTLCVDPPSDASNVGCGHGLQDVSSVVVSYGPAPTA